MVNKLSIYVSECYDVYKNLATEKYLFDNVVIDEIILYLWQNDNTVVIGRNQNAYAECNTGFVKEQNINVARRLSGGGAVFHDLGNLNFTFICAKDNLNIKRNMQIIADACSKAGIETEISGRNDILCDGRKFSGNAFYDLGEKAYHHGTIMINTDLGKMQKALTPSLEKLSSKGVKSVKSRVMNLGEISPLLTCKQMKDYLICSFENIYDKKSQRINEINEKNILQTATEYSSHEYIFTKSPTFRFLAKGRFDWGCIEISPEIKNERITSLSVYTDALVWELSDIIKNALTGCKFTYEDVAQKLSAVLEEKMTIDISELLCKTNSTIN